MTESGFRFVPGKEAKRARDTQLQPAPDLLAIHHQWLPHYFDQAYLLSDGAVLMIRTAEPPPPAGADGEIEELWFDDEDLLSDDVDDDDQLTQAEPQLEEDENPSAARDEYLGDEGQYESILKFFEAEEEWESWSFEDIGVAGIYASREALLQEAAQRLEEIAMRQEWRELRAKRNSADKRHIVSPFNVTPRFANEVPALIDALLEYLPVERSALDRSLESLRVLDEAMGRVGYDTCTQPHIFRCVLAYVGEVIRTEVGGQWVILWKETDESWVPYIMDEESWFYNPYYAPYRVLSQEAAESQLLLAAVRRWGISQR